MPVYLFRNPNNGEIKEIVQKINDPHVYSEGEIQFERIYSIPQTIIDGRIDPYSAKDFVQKTGKKKGTVGDLWEASRACAEKRGADHPVNQQAVKNYTQRRGGKSSLTESRQKLKEELAPKGFDIEF